MSVFRKQTKHVDPTGTHFAPATLTTAAQRAAAYQDAIESAAAAHQALAALQRGGVGPTTVPSGHSFLHVDGQGNPVIGPTGAPGVGVVSFPALGLGPTGNGPNGYVGGSPFTANSVLGGQSHLSFGLNRLDLVSQERGERGEGIQPEHDVDSNIRDEEEARRQRERDARAPDAGPPPRSGSGRNFDPDSAGATGYLGPLAGLVSTRPLKLHKKPVSSTGDPDPSGDGAGSGATGPSLGASLGPSLNDAPVRERASASALAFGRGSPLVGRGDPPPGTGGGI